MLVSGEIDSRHGPSLLRRLAFIKYLYSIAAEQCGAAEPLAGAGLLTLHDAVELFLQLAAEHLNVTAKAGDLKDYWTCLAPKLSGGALSHQASMNRLNRARVDLKHHGTHPSRLDLDAFKVATSEFLGENCPIVFGIEFESISLSEFVQPVDARNRLNVAEELCLTGEFDKAAEQLAISFDIMLRAYIDQKRDRFRSSPFDFGPDISKAKSAFHAFGINGRSQFAINHLVESVESMQDALRVIAIGLDFRGYVRFKSITTYVLRKSNGDYYLNEWQDIERDVGMIQYCRDYIIESALRLRN